jgi:AraC-like DNA-binding protein
MPWSRVLSFTDPYCCQVAIQAADVELYPTTRGHFHADLTQIGLNRLWMQRFHQKLAQVNAVAIRPGRRVIGFLTKEHQPTLQHCGMDVSAGEIIVNDFDMMHQRSGADLHYGSMSLTLGDFDAAAKAISGREFPGAPLKHLVRPSPTLMSRLLELHKMVGQIAETTPGVLELPEVVQALEQQLIHVMVRCLTDGLPSKMTPGSHRHDAIVAKFEEFLEANPNTPLYLPEICAAVGAAERTLRIACEEHLGMGPIRYLALRRMHLVRRALLRSVSSTTTVTRIATDHGFWELGRFAVSYRALFGETPSVTLQRPPDDRLTLQNRPSSFGGIGARRAKSHLSPLRKLSAVCG